MSDSEYLMGLRPEDTRSAFLVMVSAVRVSAHTNWQWDNPGCPSRKNVMPREQLRALLAERLSQKVISELFAKAESSGYAEIRLPGIVAANEMEWLDRLCGGQLLHVR